jgi:hypothetical protein
VCVVLCGDESWSLILREEQRLQKKSVMHNDDFYNYCSSPNIVTFDKSKEDDMAGTCNRMCIILNEKRIQYHHHHHHHSEHGQGLGLKTCSFEAQVVPGRSILLSVFPYTAIPEGGTGRPASVGGFYPFVPGGLPICFDTV